MSAALAPFDFQGQTVRVVTDAHGEPWWVAADVAAVLELGNVHSSLALLDEDERSLHTVESRPVSVISESGLYSLVLRSRKPEAKDFKRWITRVVIPAIRRTGSYSVTVTESAPDLSDPTQLAHYFEVAAQTARELVAARGEIAELAPKAEVADRFLTASESSRLIAQVAKELDLTERNLRQFLRDEGMLFTRQMPCGHTTYDFYARHASHFEAKEVPVEHGFGRMAMHYTVRVTPQGVALITKRLAAYRQALTVGAPA